MSNTNDSVSALKDKFSEDYRAMADNSISTDAVSNDAVLIVFATQLGYTPDSNKEEPLDPRVRIECLLKGHIDTHLADIRRSFETLCGEQDQLIVAPCDTAETERIDEIGRQLAAIAKRLEGERMGLIKVSLENENSDMHIQMLAAKTRTLPMVDALIRVTHSVIDEMVGCGLSVSSCSFSGVLSDPLEAHGLKYSDGTWVGHNIPSSEVEKSVRLAAPVICVQADSKDNGKCTVFVSDGSHVVYHNLRGDTDTLFSLELDSAYTYDSTKLVEFLSDRSASNDMGVSHRLDSAPDSLDAGH